MKRPRRQKTVRPDFTEPRAFVTPEGVDLQLRVGSFTERALAFGIDAAIILGGLIAFSIFALIVSAWSGSKWVGEAMMVVWLLGLFGVRNFYFLLFELRPRAATIGKRAMGLRVVAADGGQLTADAVFARNAMREVEVFLPLAFLFARGEGVDGALITLGGIWSGVLALFPLFNRDRRRLGDLAAGTLVVKSPKVVLQRDLVERTAPAALGFAPAQLDAYGIKELHVLEQVLRGGDRRAITQVAERIRAKIAWEGPADMADRIFLDAYYAALRGRLESRMLFGHRRKDKFDKA